jgi:hypothetical protein
MRVSPFLTDWPRVDTNYAWWQEDFAVFHVRIGDVLAEQQDFLGARKHYRASKTIAEQLIAADKQRAMAARVVDDI